MKKNRQLSVIILAAGKGKRMKEENINKVSHLLHGKPLISYTIDLLQKIKISNILVVVGHAKESVKNSLKDTNVLFIEQKKQLGTGHAVKCAMGKITETTTDIIILYGDDSYLYEEKLLKKIISKHIISEAMLTFLTIKIANPAGLGRIIRNSEGRVIEIIEEKDATEDQKKINEINPNCYIFRSVFLRKYITKICKSPFTGEYYLPSLIKIAKENNENIQSIEGGFLPWKGINTKEDLEYAQILVNKNI